MFEKPRISARRARLLAKATLAATVAVLLAPPHVAAAPNGYDVVTEYATSPVSSPVGIITGPDGKIWYTGGTTDAVVQVDPATGATLQTVSLTFGAPGCTPIGLTIGPDRNLWTACFGLDYLVRITTAGVATQYRLTAGSAPWALTAGSDGGLWFTEEGTGKIGRLDMTSFAIYEFSLPAGAAAKPRGIAAGTDGSIFVAESGVNRIGWFLRATLQSFQEFTPVTANSSPFDITAGPDGYFYFTESTGDHIGRVGTDGKPLVEFPVPTASISPHEIAVGPDGNLWFTYFGNKIGSMTPAGTFQDFSPPTINSHPFGIATGPDGNVWFAESGGFKIGKVGARHNALFLDHTGIGFGHVPTGTTTAPQRVTLFNTGPEILSPFTPTIAGDSGGGYTITSTNCSTGPVAVGSSCFVDVQFKRVRYDSSGATDTLILKTGAGTAAEQTLTVDLEAVTVDVRCDSLSVTTDVPSPQNLGAVVTLSATATGCPDPNPLFQFRLRSPEGVWTTVQDFSNNSKYVWNTDGLEAGTYERSVGVRDAANQNTFDVIDDATFTLTATPCASTNLSPDVASPQAAGVTVTFTATSAGCPAPLYQWWLRDSNGSWAVVLGHDFAHSSSTLAWNTSALTEGTYQVGVWAKQAGSVASYEAFSIVTYTLTVIHCSAVNLVASLTSPQPTQSSIVLTPTATACPSPVYRFYVRDNTGVWHVAQDFGGGNTYTWNSTSPPVDTYVAGTYLLGVWARQPGSVNSYDAFAFITFSLTSGPACTVNIAPDKASPQNLGTSVTWTATANGCANTPLSYQFWVSPPGGAWAIVQPFSTANTFAWTGAVDGSSQVGVWVKQAGSTSSYDNFALTTFTVTPSPPTQICQSVNVGAAPASPSAVGTTITFTASGATGCSSPQYRWWVRDPNGTWFLEQDYNVAGNTFNWSTAGDGSTWLVGVWARQSGSTAIYEAYSFITYSLTGPPKVCVSAGISASPVSPQPAGTNVTFTATATGCSSPQYRWWVFYFPGQWVMVQDYSVAGNTFTWATSGLAFEAYTIGVWARQAGSTASYEAYAIVTYHLGPNGPPCTSLAMWPTHGAMVNDITAQPPQPAGATIGLTATSSGCPSPQYAFYYQGMNTASNNFYGGYLIQDFSPASTATWNTSGLPRGLYRVIVAARQPGSVFVFVDAYANTSYMLV